MPAIQKDLKLTSDQLKQMDRVREDARKKGRERGEELSKNIAQGGGPIDPAVLRQTVQTLRAEEEAAILSCLTAAQRDRLEQIKLQQQGPLAVAQPEIQEKLSIGPEQNELIQSIVAELNEARGGIAQRSGEMFSQLVRPNEDSVDQKAKRARFKSPQFAAQTKKTESQMQKLRQQSDQLEQQAIQQISRVLTRQQRLAFDRMLGQPFRLDVPKGSAGLGAGASPKDGGKAKAAAGPAPTAKARAVAKPLRMTKSAARSVSPFAPRKDVLSQSERRRCRHVILTQFFSTVFLGRPRRRNESNVDG